ncbi:MAG TPA: hypothetical protein VHZ04_01595 [Candidatus Paceibacterota bacterium]|nr:hypothetical protein [Candidatus Paceibacterota bacterium]
MAIKPLVVDYSQKVPHLQHLDGDTTNPLFLRPVRRDTIHVDISAIHWTSIKEARSRWHLNGEFKTGESGKARGKILLDGHCMEALMQRPDVLHAMLKQHPKIHFYGATIMTHEGYNEYPCLSMGLEDPWHIEMIHGSYEPENGTVPYYQIN